MDDWKEAFQRDLQEQKEKEIEQRKDDFERRLHANLRNIPGYIRQNNIEKDEFYQAWGLMSGMWNTVDFERIRKIVRIQKEYPEVVKVANKMGRMADDEGQEQLHVAQGNVYKMEHSSKSDILGITVGNDLNALLPTDWRIVPMMSWKTCLSINMLPENFRPSAINPRSCNRHGDWK